jgi:PAS domain S-box-containing protein
LEVVVRDAAKLDVDRSGESIERLFGMSMDLLGTASLDGYFTMLNPAWQRTLGWTKRNLMGKPFIEFVHSDDVDATLKASSMLARPGSVTIRAFENRYRMKSGGYRTLEWDVISDDHAIYFAAHDVTERKVMEVGRAHDASFVRAVIDNVADGLYVTDSVGNLTMINPAGVQLLGYTSDEELLGQSPHAVFHHSHANGAEFSITDCALAKVRITGRAIHAEDDTFWRKDGSRVAVSYSSSPIPLAEGMGSIVSFRDISESVSGSDSKPVQAAEAQCYSDIRDALAEDRFVLYAQPVIDMTTGETMKHELLLRMVSPDGEIIAPKNFLPVAEKFGLINRIDQWAITHGVEIAATGMCVSINLSAESMGSVDILAHIEQEIARTGADPANLVFELTESAVMKDLNEGRRFADRLVALGCTFALDDFGTGYASLTYLRELPITYVKIDGRFVNRIVSDQSDASLVQAVIFMARSLGKVTIAEGIEDEATLEKLRSFGVDLGQGYHIGRPSPLPA